MVLEILNATEKVGNKTAGEEISKLFENLSFNWPYLVFSLITIGFLTLIITFLVYKPVKRMVKNRQDFIQQNIDASIKAKEDALKIQEQSDQKIIEASQHANTILNNAKSESERIVAVGIANAKKKAEMILEQANILQVKKQNEFEIKQKKIIMENAVEIAKKIIGREIKDKDNLKLINDVLLESKNKQK